MESDSTSAAAATRTPRESLLRAGAKIFAERGYAGASLNDIASAAGLTTGAVYSNFRGKADLAFAVLDRQSRRARMSAFEDVDHDSPIEEQFRHAIAIFVADLDASRPWFQLELECTALAARDTEMLNRLRAADAALAADFGTALASSLALVGLESTVAPEPLATALTAVTNGIALERLKDPERMPLELIEQILASVFGGFTRPMS